MKPSLKSRLLRIFSIDTITQEAKKQVDIITILADDLGYRGSQIKIPNTDSLAKNGVLLESFYGLPLCPPHKNNPSNLQPLL